MLAILLDTRMAASAEHTAWSGVVNEVFAQVAKAFANAAVRMHRRQICWGCYRTRERKSSRTLAKSAENLSPDGMQRLLNSSPWNEDACRETCALVWSGIWGPGAVLAVFETSSLKKRRISRLRFGLDGFGEPLSCTLPTTMAEFAH